MLSYGQRVLRLRQFSGLVFRRQLAVATTVLVVRQIRFFIADFGQQQLGCGTDLDNGGGNGARPTARVFVGSLYRVGRTGKRNRSG